MTVRWITAFVDTVASASSAAEDFWCAVTATTPSTRRGEHDEFVTLVPRDGDAFLRGQVVSVGSNGVHLDLHVTDLGDTVGRAVRLGAEVTAEHGSLVVARSPGGLPFCVVAHAGEAVRPGPSAWPGGGTSLVDQVCLDIAASGFDREADFWAALTGWSRTAGSRPEFDVLQRPPELPLRLLLQRVGGDGPTRAHLDLACDDVAAEAHRHREFGAHVIGRGPTWTTMRDPAGRAYCLTARDPRTGTLMRSSANETA